MKKNKVLITTVPFGEWDQTPLKMLEDSGVDYTINPLNRKLTEDELKEMISDYSIVIAGTEPITSSVMKSASSLKLISRVGIGLDSVELGYASENNINVSYTPDAPSPAVSELTVGLALSLLRKVNISDSQMHSGQWKRYMGRRIAECTVGIIGIGRIGTRLIEHLQGGFAGTSILVNDIDEDAGKDMLPAECLVSKEEIYRNADIITLHLPLTAKTKNLISDNEIKMMKKDVILINTSRGGMINESALEEALKEGLIGGAAIDVFDNEPYSGPLSAYDNCILTSHMGSMTQDCRAKMEIEATEEAVRYIKGEPLLCSVPEYEYIISRGM